METKKYKKNSPEYNKMYYDAHKDEIKEKLNKREICDICGRSTNHQHMKRHQKTNICKSSKPKYDKIALLTIQIEELKNIVSNINNGANDGTNNLLSEKQK